MGRNVFWKSVLRRKGSLLLFMALLVTASFGFMLRVLEYLSVTGEIARISENYQPIGMLSFAEEKSEVSTFDSDSVRQAIALLEESPYVEYVDEKRYGSAVLSDIYNADLDGWTSSRTEGLGLGVRTNDVLVWAEVEDVKNTMTPGLFRYGFRVKEPIYGYPDYMEPRNKLVVYLDSMTVNGQSEPVMEEGKTYLFKGYYPPRDNSSDGNVLRFEMLPLEENLWFLEGHAGDAIAQQYVDEADAARQEQNRHAMLAITTAGMNFLPEVQDSLMTIRLEDGRWLNHEDHEEERKVCVVTKDFADTRGLQVGDTLRMMLLDWRSSDFFYGYVTDSDDDGWKSCDQIETELEIVGIYSNFYGELADQHSLGYESCAFYLPDSLMPEHYRQEELKWADSVSFVLTSPQVQDAFLQELGEKLDALGISCEFVENSWEAYYRSAEQIAQGARCNLWIFAAVIAFALLAVAFLYTWQRKREIAIARALGVPAGKAAFAACLPMLVLGMIGMLAGCVCAWSYGLRQAKKTLAAIASGGHVELSPYWLAGIVLLQWMVLLLVLLAGSFFYARRPVLELLQGGQARGQKRPAIGEGSGKVKPAKERGANTGKEAVAFAAAADFSVETSDAVREAGNKSVLAAMAGFLKHHLTRVSLRSLCALMAAAAFVAAIGWIRQSMKSSEEELDVLYRNTTVEAGITRANSKVFVVLSEEAGAYIYPQTVKRLLDTGFIEEAYLEAGSTNRIGKDQSTGMKQMTFLGFRDARQFLAKDWFEEPKIHYGDGFGEELFEQEFTPTGDGKIADMPAVILPEKLWEKWDLRPGKRLMAADSSDHTIVTVVAGGYYEGDLDGIYKDVVLVPAALQEFLELNLNYVSARFTIDPKRNRELEEFRELAERTVESPGAGKLELEFVIWDSELRQVAEPMEKNITLMKILYPIANIVSFLIAAGLAVLLLFQRRREAAILRVMGVGVVHVRLTLALELLTVNLAGILLGTGILMIRTGARSPAILGIAALVYFAGGVLGAIVGCILVTGARPLELLQVKE